MIQDERHCAAPSNLGEMCFESQEANLGAEDMTIISQLLESNPEIWTLFSDANAASTLPSGFDPGMDISSSFANMDVNLNQNFLYNQDFSHYSDLQFNMLVNENQTLQTEPQDCPTNVVHVKTEEEL